MPSLPLRDCLTHFFDNGNVLWYTYDNTTVLSYIYIIKFFKIILHHLLNP
jgi:hypothetical protein